MLGRDRANFSGKLRSADRIDLIGMNLRNQSVFFACFEDRARFIGRKDARLTKDVAEFCKFLHSNLGDHFFTQQLNIILAMRLKGRWQGMCAEECRSQIHRMPFIQVADHAKLFQLLFCVKAIAAFGLASRCTKAKHFVKSSLSFQGQFFFGRCVACIDRRKNPAARSQNFQVRNVPDFHCKLVLPPSAENQMRMRVNEAGRHKAAFCVDYTISVFG